MQITGAFFNQQLQSPSNANTVARQDLISCDLSPPSLMETSVLALSLGSREMGLGCVLGTCFCEWA